MVVSLVCIQLVNCTDTAGLLDPEHPKTMPLVEKLLNEVASVFPDNILHVGADESHVECWSSSQHAQRWMAAHQDFCMYS
jgi:N-acetyl-beta-hexosaminidase